MNRKKIYEHFFFNITFVDGVLDGRNNSVVLGSKVSLGIKKTEVYHFLASSIQHTSNARNATQDINFQLTCFCKSVFVMNLKF